MGKNRTIYFRTSVAEKLEGLDAGRLINNLLEDYFASLDGKVAAEFPDDERNHYKGGKPAQTDAKYISPNAGGN